MEDNLLNDSSTEKNYFDEVRNEVQLNFHCVHYNDINDETIVSIFEKFGFIVIQDILSNLEVEFFLKDLWSNPNLLGRKGIQRDNPMTWENNVWPNDPNNKGFLPTDLTSQSSWDIRQHPKIYNIFSTILKETSLLCSLDRIGCMRPTKDILLNNGNRITRNDWKSDNNFFHWDQNPWKNPNFEGVQGLVTFTKHTPTSGGFHCVPGFHHYFSSWGENNRKHEQKGNLINVPKEDLIRKYLTKICIEPGSLLIWDSRIPHGNFPNQDNTFRIVQYITMHKFVEERAKSSKILYANLVEPSGIVNLTELGRKLMGFPTNPLTPTTNLHPKTGLII
jgi:hypothetical protein